MGQRDSLDAACYMVESPMGLFTTVALFLEGYGGQNELKVVLHTMLHLAEQNLSVLRRCNGSHQACLFIGHHRMAEHRSNESSRRG